MEIKTGFIAPIIDSTHYVLGASPVPQNVLQEDGQWIKYVNEFEPQNKGYESWGCTIHGSINAIEILMRRQFLPDNYSERYSYIKAGITPPGADPHTTLESLRKTGLIDEEILPWTPDLATLEEYASFKNANESECDKKAQEWLNTYELKHEWVPNNKESMMSALRYSPLGVGVYAWQINSKGLYFTPEGQQANHWCLVIGYVEGEYWLVQDSYMQDGSQIKRLEWDFPFPFVKRYSLVVREQTKKKLSLLEQLLLTLREWLNLSPKEPVKSVTMPEDVIINKVKINQFAKAIENFEGYYMGSRSFRNHNPGNLKWANQRLAVGKDKQGFAQFKSYEDGFITLCTMIENACTGKSKIYKPEMTISQFFSIFAPASDNNKPDNYAKFVADRVGLLVTDPISKLIS